MEIKNPFWNGKTIWESYRLIDKGKWHISWDSLLNYNNLKLSTPKPLTWFLRLSNSSESFLIKILGFTFIYYKIHKCSNCKHEISSICFDCSGKLGGYSDWEPKKL